MTFWSGERLSIDGRAQAIVYPFSEKRIDCSGYTLTLGSEAYVTPRTDQLLNKRRKQHLKQPNYVNIEGNAKPRDGGTVIIPPGQFAFLLTEETVCMPKDAMGFISLKSKQKFSGLINVSGFHVDPGFKGKLIFSVFNAGPTDLHFQRGEEIFLLWLADLSFKGPKARGKEMYHKKTPGYVEIPTDMINRIAKEVDSLQELSSRVKSLSSRVTIISTIAGAVGVVCALVLALVSTGMLKPTAAPQLASSSTIQSAAN